MYSSEKRNAHFHWIDFLESYKLTLDYSGGWGYSNKEQLASGSTEHSLSHTRIIQTGGKLALAIIERITLPLCYDTGLPWSSK